MRPVPRAHHPPNREGQLSTPLAVPTLSVRILYRKYQHSRSIQKVSSYHFGLASALQSARQLKREGIPAWIEGNGTRATTLTPSRSPAMRARGYR